MENAELLTVLDFLLKTVAMRTDLETTLRQQALSCVQWAAKQKPRGASIDLLHVLLNASLSVIPPLCM